MNNLIYLGELSWYDGIKLCKEHNFKMLNEDQIKECHRLGVISQVWIWSLEEAKEFDDHAMCFTLGKALIKYSSDKKYKKHVYALKN